MYSKVSQQYLEIAIVIGLPTTCLPILSAWLWELCSCNTGFQPHSFVCLWEWCFQPSLYLFEQREEIRGKCNNFSFFVLVSIKSSLKLYFTVKTWKYQ